MSDDRISESTKPAGCPVCATGFTSTPGASCPACGRVFTQTVSNVVPDVRRPPAWKGFALLGWALCPPIGVGLLLTIHGLTVGFSRNFFKYVPLPCLFWLAILLLVPTALRTHRLASQRKVAGPAYLLGALITSLGVASLACVSSIIAGNIVCFAVAVSGKSTNQFDAPAVFGGVAGLVIFLLVFIRLWPREGATFPPRSHDPEN